MAQKYFKTGIPVASGFDLGSHAPLDSRSVVATLADRDSMPISQLYKGLMVFVEEDAKYYILVNHNDAYAELEWAELGGGVGSLAVDTYEEAIALASDENIGQVIYVKTTTYKKDGGGYTNNSEEAEKDEAGNPIEYSAGPYIVTGAGTISKLGITSPSGDIEGDVEDLKGDVGILTEDVSVLDSSVKDLDASLKVVDSSVSDLIDSVNSLDTSINYIENVLDVKFGSGLEKNAEDNSLQVKIDPVEGNLIEASDAGLKVVLPDTVASKDDVKVVQDAVDAIKIPEVSEYTVAKLDTAEEGYATSYQLQKDGAGVGAVINIPKDMVVSSGEVRELTDDEIITDERPQGVYVVLTLANATNDKLYIAAKDLVDNYTGSTYVDVTSTREISIKYNDLKSALQADFDTVYETVGAAATVKSEITETLKDYALTANVYSKTDADSTFVKSDGYVEYTQAEKDKLATVAEGAEVNVVKEVDTTGVLGLDESGKLSADLSAYALSATVDGSLATKVDKEEDKSLVDDALITKLGNMIEIKSVGTNLAVSDAGELTVDLSNYATSTALIEGLAAKLDASAKVNGVSFVDGVATLDAGDIALEVAITSDNGEGGSVEQYPASTSVQSVLQSLNNRITAAVSGGLTSVAAGDGIAVTAVIGNSQTVSIKKSSVENNMLDLKTDGVYVPDMRSYWEEIK